MIEFGSDFHTIDNPSFLNEGMGTFRNRGWLMADGRQCLVTLIRHEGWKRLWVPIYFCYEVLAFVQKATQIQLMFYGDYPLHPNDQEDVMGLPYQEGDALLRMNYWGMRGWRSSRGIPVPVVEDHSHDLTGEWATNSDADWCVASLRKSLPIPGGGSVWSPKNHLLTLTLSDTEECKSMMAQRWKAMDMKADYLKGENTSKDQFRWLFVETEGWFEKAEPSSLDVRTLDFISRFDIDAWQSVKRGNWLFLSSQISNKEQVILPECITCNMFSLVILTDNQEQRETLRHKLIDHSVYPAILWQVPTSVSRAVQDVSNRMLSIHCDGRYSEADIRQLAEIINHSLE